VVERDVTGLLQTVASDKPINRHAHAQETFPALRVVLRSGEVASAISDAKVTWVSERSHVKCKWSITQ
jgi:hypothetical protein